MNTRVLQVANLGLALFLGACGDDPATVTCGTNTTLVDGACIANDGPTCGANTTLTNGMCIATTPTTCGPGTVLAGDHCVVDQTAPSPVTGLTAAVSGTNVNLTWTAGAGSTGSLVVRLDAGETDDPAYGKTYAVGDTLANGGKVIAVGAATTFADAFTVPGRYSYRVYSINATGNYGTGREAATITTIPTQAATLALALTAGTATVSTQPANLAVAAANLVFTTDHANVDVTITNNTAGPLYSPRIVVKSLSVGTLAGASTNAAGDDYVLATIGALLPGASRTVSIQIDGVLVTDTINASIELEESGLASFGSNVGASKGGGSVSVRLPTVRGNNNDDTVLTDSAFAPSGRYLYGITKWTTGVSRIDTATGDATTIAAFESPAAAGMCMRVGADNVATIAFGLGSHRQGSSGTGLGVARIDLTAMTVLQTASLDYPTTARSQSCAFSADGSRVALSAGSDVYLFDVTTMTFVDTVPATAADIDPVDSGLGNLHQLAFDAAGTSIYAIDKNSTIVKIDPAFAVTNHHTVASSTPVWSLQFVGTKLWWAASNGVFSFDGTTEVKVPVVTSAHNILSISGTTAKITTNNGVFETIDLTTGAASEISTIDNTSRMGHRGAVMP
ncbi:MAG: hypothetical protein NT062_32745 [Proteobacteria bacterium]|nr:hypothetical protein [Pseudomonadota bacterium]